MNGVMHTLQFTYWKDGEVWIGHLLDYPDYRTQGESFEELQENLRDIYQDITGGEIPCIRKVAELEVS